MGAKEYQIITTLRKQYLETDLQKLVIAKV